MALYDIQMQYRCLHYIHIDMVQHEYSYELSCSVGRESTHRKNTSHQDIQYIQTNDLDYTDHIRFVYLESLQ